jgi:hypothetical protein
VGGPKQILSCGEMEEKSRSEIDDNQEEEPRQNRWHQTELLKSESDNTYCALLLHTFACEKGISGFVSWK